jgi:hypothetical protein
VRNVVAYGDPLYPATVAPLLHGARQLAQPYGPSILTAIAGHPSAFGDSVWPVWRFVYGIGGGIAAAAMLLVAVLSVRRLWAERSRESAIRLAVASAGLAFAVVYVALPYTAQQTAPGRFDNVAADVRYLTAPLTLGLALAAYLAGRYRLLGAVLVVAGGLAVEQGIGRIWGNVPFGTVAVAVVLIVLFVYWIARHRGLVTKLWRQPRLVTAAVVAGALALVTLGAWRLEIRQVGPSTYAAYDPTFAWVAAHAPATARIAIAGPLHGNGPQPVLPLLGPRLTRRVEFLGRPVDHQLFYYEDPGAWWRALARGRYDLLVIDRAREFALLPQSRDLAYALAARLPVLALSADLVLFRAPRPGTPEPRALGARGP